MQNDLSCVCHEAAATDRNSYDSVNLKQVYESGDTVTQVTTSNEDEFSTPIKKKSKNTSIKPDIAGLSTNRTLVPQENKRNTSRKETPASESLESRRYIPDSSPKKYQASTSQNNAIDAVFGLYAPYIEDIFKYAIQSEESPKITPNFLSHRNQIDERMRAMLLNWMVDMQVNFNLRTQTLYLAAILVDRYISEHSVHISNLQLLGITLLFIASKYEDPYPPLLQDLIDASSKKHTKEEVVRYESQILSELGFKLSAPSALSFLYRYSQSLECSKTVLYLARYLLELGLLEPRMVAHKPSLKALTALYISCIYHEVYEKTKFDIFEYDIDTIKECATNMLTGFQKYHRSRSFTAVRDKYSKESFEKVSAVDIAALLSASEPYIVIKKIKWSSYF